MERQPDPITRSDGSTGAGDSPITLLLVETMDLFRTALASLLSDEPDLEVLDALKDHQSVIQVALRLRPDVVVMDVDLPGTASLSAIRELRRRLPRTQIVALTAARPSGLVQRLLAADVLGAIDKNGPVARLLEAIRGAATGEVVIDPSLAIAALAVQPNPLTPREMDILRLVAEGASGPEISQQLHLSRGTVRNYLSKIFTKTGARTRADAVRIARDAGWLDA